MNISDEEPKIEKRPKKGKKRTEGRDSGVEGRELSGSERRPKPVPEKPSDSSLVPYSGSGRHLLWSSVRTLAPPA